MKKLASIAIALIAAVGAFAQPAAGTFSITPKVGLSTACLSGYSKNLRLSQESAEGTKYSQATEATNYFISGVVAGAEVGYQVSKHFALSAGLLYSQQGAERMGDLNIPGASFRDEDQMKLSYLNVPILANFYVVKGLALKVGVQPGFLLSAKENIRETATGGVASADRHEKVDAKSSCKTFDFSIPVGISYEFKNIVLDARYNIGMTDVFKSKIPSDGTSGLVGSQSNKNQVLQITLGYKFNL